MTTKFPDRVADTTTTTGTGTLTISGTPPAQFQSFNSGVGNANTCRIRILDANGVDWEVTDSVYTNSGTTLSRGLFHSSSTGSRISLTSGTHSVGLVNSGSDYQGSYAAARRVGLGGELTAGTSNVKVTCAAGAEFVEGLDETIEFIAITDTDVTAALGASRVQYVYRYYADLATAPVLVASTIAPASTPFGPPNARSASATIGGNAANLHRFICSIYTDASSHILPFNMISLGAGYARMDYTAVTSSAPYRQVSNDAAHQTFFQKSLAGIIPPLVGTRMEALVFLTDATVAAAPYAQFSLDGVSGSSYYQGYTTTALGQTATTLQLRLNRASPSIYYLTGLSSTALYLDVYSYEFQR